VSVLSVANDRGQFDMDGRAPPVSDSGSCALVTSYQTPTSSERPNGCQKWAKRKLQADSRATKTNSDPATSVCVLAC